MFHFKKMSIISTEQNSAIQKIEAKQAIQILAPQSFRTTNSCSNPHSLLRNRPKTMRRTSNLRHPKMTLKTLRTSTTSSLKSSHPRHQEWPAGRSQPTPNLSPTRFSPAAWVIMTFCRPSLPFLRESGCPTLPRAWWLPPHTGPPPSCPLWPKWGAKIKGRRQRRRLQRPRRLRLITPIGCADRSGYLGAPTCRFQLIFWLLDWVRFDECLLDFVEVMDIFWLEPSSSFRLLLEPSSSFFEPQIFTFELF